MEEDIKILEKFIISYKKEIGNHCLNCPSDEDIQALENVIKGYKDGEEIIKNTVKENLEYQKYIRELEENLKIATAMLTKGQYPEKNKGDNDFAKQFIPKTKVAMKLLECLAKRNNCVNDILLQELNGRISVLQELKEDK